MLRFARPFLLAVLIAGVFSLFGTSPLSAPPGGGAATMTTAATSASTGVQGAAPAPDASEEMSGASKAQQAVHHQAPNILFLLLAMIVLAKIGGDLFERLKQPAVLGELIFGIIFGNLGLMHLGSAAEAVSRIQQQPEVRFFITMLSEVGVVLLLFEVGMESTVSQMLSVGKSALLVAIVGVAAPLGLGLGIGHFFMPSSPFTVHLFLGAVMAATSVGITARVLRDLGQIERREAKIVLGAAVIDDILGLVVLAVAQGFVAAEAAGQSVAVGAIALIAAKAIGFFIVAIVVGLLVSPRLYKLSTYLHGQGILLAVTLAWCFGLAWIGSLVGVAPIIGAFAAGLVLETATFKDWQGRETEVENLLKPITSFLVPVFFVNTGMSVDLRVLSSVHVFGMAALITVAAIAGKQACSLVVREKGLNRAAIGVGMVPRGEVGLIVANIGQTMRTPSGEPMVSRDTFSIVVIMVMLTTMVTPPALTYIFHREKRRKREQDGAGSAAVGAAKKAKATG